MKFVIFEAKNELYMKLERVKQLLKKVNALIENLDEQGETSAIERDLLLRYLRDLYENVSQREVTNEVLDIEPNDIQSPISESVQLQATPAAEMIADPAPKVTIPEIQSPLVEPVISGEEAIPKVTTVPDQNQTTFYDAKPTSEPIEKTLSTQSSIDTPLEDVDINKFENPVQYFPPTDEKDIPEESAIPPTSRPNVEPVMAESTKSASEVKERAAETATLVSVAFRFESIFTERSTKDLSDQFQQEKVVTIEGAMAINERILAINELFGGDHNVFMETVGRINNMTDFTSARNYLIQNAAERFSWDSDERAPIASDFIQLVRRKFA